MNQDDLPTQEFLDDYTALVQMPEAENPDLYKRLRLLIDKNHERREGTYAIGADGFALLTPEERQNLEMRFERERLALFEKRQKEAEEFERMSESQRAAVKAKADAQAEEDLAFDKIWAADLHALVDEYRKMRPALTPKS